MPEIFRDNEYPVFGVKFGTQAVKHQTCRHDVNIIPMHARWNAGRDLRVFVAVDHILIAYGGAKAIEPEFRFRQIRSG